MLPTARIEPIEVSDYREELILSVSNARDLAVENIQAAQRKYKSQYDKKATGNIDFKGETGF